MELLQSKLLRGCGDALLKVIAMGNTEPPESWFCALSSTPASFLSRLLPQVGGQERSRAQGGSKDFQSHF